MSGTKLGASRFAASRLGLPIEEYMARVAKGEHHCGRCKGWYESTTKRTGGYCPSCRSLRHIEHRKPRTEPRKKGGPKPGSQMGENNPNWRGGRVLEPRGYVLIRRPDHPQADCRGYVYEHILVAEAKIGRFIADGEEVHHKDENRSNNDPDNLEVKASRADHRRDHRKYERGRRDPGEPNPTISCSCGCGGTFAKYDGSGRPRLYINGHNNHHLSSTRQSTRKEGITA